MTYEELKKNERDFLAMTGYTDEEFSALLIYFEEMFVKYMNEYTLDGFRRENRRYTNYKNCPLPTIEDKLLFILVYLKTNPIQTAHAKMFGMTQPKANRWIHTLHIVLNQTLAHIEELPARPDDEIEVLSEEYEENTYWHDGTERTINRPLGYQEQKEYYSGKKKSHTIKNIILIDVLCYVIFLSATCTGKTHDKTIADSSNYNLPAGSTLYQDKGWKEVWY